jgi:NhaA family Na+:H+ antiporter
MLPGGMRPKDVVVLGCVAGMGFTVALFVATVAFPSTALATDLTAAKMGALFSFAAGLVAFIASRLLRVEKVHIA